MYLMEAVQVARVICHPNSPLDRRTLPIVRLWQLDRLAIPAWQTSIVDEGVHTKNHFRTQEKRRAQPAKKRA
jgi:hypothetical protein